ncbi:MAG: hypothetical protein M1821_000905 [Bathelium mastoideum]|nr:MAG: hypothetical protein M1821_000905 [Bathelium mastoideum]
MTIGVAIIGSGIFVRREHLPAVKANPSLALKAVYSRSLNSAQNLVLDVQNVDLYSEDAGTGKGYKDLLQRPDVQAVIIALPIVTQPSYIREALRAGKHVLAEKPIAKDVATATELLDWYHQNIDTSKVTWCVAENYRFFDSIAFASEQVKKLGRVLGFNIRVQKTEWRKKPQYQGGFLLDAGIHFVAGLRMLLGTDHAPARVSAFTAQLQQHLPPIDTLDAVIKTNSGATGTLSASFGTTYDEYRLSVACEKGVVFREKVGTDFQRGIGGAVVVQMDGREERTEFASEAFGVKQEINAWSESLELGRPDSRQSPEEAMKDLKMLEAMLWSGEQNGQPVDLSPS